MLSHQFSAVYARTLEINPDIDSSLLWIKKTATSATLRHQLMSHSPTCAIRLHRMSHQSSINDRLRPTKRSRKSLVKSLAASMATNGWTDGTHKHNGIGNRLHAEPYCDEVRPVGKRFLADYENDNSLAFNNYTDSCPELTMKRLQTMEGFDYADELPFGPLPWFTGFPAPGYVPKTNPLNGRWATVSGGDAVTVTTEPKLYTDIVGKITSTSFR